MLKLGVISVMLLYSIILCYVYGLLFCATLIEVLNRLFFNRTVLLSYGAVLAFSYRYTFLVYYMYITMLCVAL